MKLLVVTNDFPPRVGGIEDYVRQLVTHLAPEVTSVVLAPRHAEAAAFDRGFPQRVIRWPAFPMLPTPRLAREVSALCAAERPDALLFGAAMPLALIAGTVWRRARLPIVACTHGVEPAVARLPGGGRLLRAIGRHVALWTGVSSWAEAPLRRALGPRARIERLPSGIDPLRFHPRVSGAAVRRRYGLEPGPVVVCVGRLVARKGQDQLIKALPLVAARFPGVRLLLVGSGPDRGRLGRLARRSGVAPRVTFAGLVPSDEVPQCIAAGDVFAMPCRSRLWGADTEALGAVFLQAAAVERVAVAGSTGGAPEAVLHDVTGLVVDGRDAAALAAALVDVLARPDRARELAAAAARRAHDELTWAAHASRLRGWLTELTAAAGAAAT